MVFSSKHHNIGPYWGKLEGPGCCIMTQTRCNAESQSTNRLHMTLATRLSSAPALGRWRFPCGTSCHLLFLSITHVY